VQTTPSDRRRGRSLAEVFSGRDNAIGFLRLLLAGLVIVDHAFPLAGHGIDPLLHWSHGQLSLGGVAVGGFFFLSGFLVTRSAQRTRSVLRYLWHRVLRIFPAFLVCLVVTAFGFAAIAYHHERGSLDGFLTSVPDESPVRYLRVNALLTMKQYNINHLLTSTPYRSSGYPMAWDGSLYTLVYEFKCYLVVAALAAGGVLLRARPLVPVLALMTYSVVLLQATGSAAVANVVPQLADQNFSRFLLYFLLGALVHLYAGSVPVDDRLGALALGITVWTLHSGGYLVLGLAALCYTVLWLATRLPFRTVGVRRDFSYGVYIYGFPVQQLLADYGLHKHGIILYTAASAAGAFVLAVLSWYVVEQPALRLKDYPVPAVLRRRPRRLTASPVPPVEPAVAARSDASV
jgi:peptidoglycan/LPS O-acetylase OafA/YrhL